MLVISGPSRDTVALFRMSESRVGELLANKYRLDKKLGSGGMGDVYRAENIAIGRVVAIKTLRAEFMSRPQIVGRFLREARAANKVRHANVVDVLDVGEDGEGVPFIVQEYLRGQDLARHFEDLGGRLAPRAALSLLLPVIDAVAAAHRVGVVHRDLKLENVFLARMDAQIVPKVLDFGISRIADDSEDHRLTSTNVTMGTPMYMCPEALRGLRFTDARSDVWSLGVMLYELLAGAPPFEGTSQAGLFLAITSDTPAPLDHSVASPALSEIIFRCLEKDPVSRFPDAGELASALRALLDGSRELTTMPVPPASASSTRRYTPLGTPALPQGAPPAPPSAGLRLPAETLDADSLPLPPAPPAQPAPSVEALPAEALPAEGPAIPAPDAALVPSAMPSQPVTTASSGSMAAVANAPSRATEAVIPLARPPSTQEPAPVARPQSLEFLSPGRLDSAPPAEPTALSTLLVPIAILSLVLSLPIFTFPVWSTIEGLLVDARTRGSLPIDGAAAGCVILAYLAKDWAMGAQTRHVAWDAFLAIFTLLGAAFGLFCAVHPGPIASFGPDSTRAVEASLPWCIALSAMLLGVHGVRRGFERSADRRIDGTDVFILCLCVPLVLSGGRVAFEALLGKPALPATVESEDALPVRRTTRGARTNPLSPRDGEPR
jgi:serine/threonine protein kinase